jgi:hypothetical protein
LAIGNWQGRFAPQKATILIGGQQIKNVVISPEMAAKLQLLLN